MGEEMADSAQQSGPGSSPEEDVARLRQRHADLQVVLDTTRDVTSTLSVGEVLQRLLDRTLVHLQSEIGSILLIESDRTLRIAVARGLPDYVVEQTRIEPGESISGHVATSAEPLLVEDIENDPRFGRRNRERYYTNSLLSAPLRLGDTVYGVLNVNNKQTREAFSPHDLRLLEAIAGHAAIAVANAQRYEEVLQRAQCDALTGLSNHGHFWSLLDVELERADRYRRELSVVMIDVDQFKAFNDRNGHIGGDEALRRIAALIRERCRSSDFAARYGGEEFAVILPEASGPGARAFGEKIRQSVESEPFGAGRAERLTVSVGVSAFPAGGDTARALVETADQQLYRAKSEGRNRVCGPE